MLADFGGRSLDFLISFNRSAAGGEFRLLVFKCSSVSSPVAVRLLCALKLKGDHKKQETLKLVR